MEPKELAKHLGLTDKHIIGKASEYSRLVQIRAPSGLGQGSLARGAACLFIACKDKDVPFDKPKACKFCCITQAQLIQVTAMCQKLLGIKDELTVKEVCKKLGHPLLIADTEDNLRRYKEKVTKSMTKEQIAYIDFTKTVYPAAAFFLAAHKNKVKVTQAAIGNSLDIQKPELQRAIASFQVMLEPPTSATPAGAAQQKPIVLGASGGVKRTRTDEEKKSSDITTPVIIPNEQKQQQSTDNNNNCDCDDGYMAFRKVAEDLGLHKCCDDDSKEKQQAPPPTKKHKKLVQTTLKF